MLDLTTTPPVQLNSFSLDKPSKIRGVCYDPVSTYILVSGYETGEMNIYEMGKPGRERFAKRVATLQTKNKVRAIGWSKERKEAFLGHADGVVSIWSAKQGASIYALKAHP